MVYVRLIYLSEWREFPYTSCLTGKKNLMTARVSMLLKSRASPDMLPLNLCNKRRLAIRHMNRPLFPTTLSIPSYDMGKYPLVYSTLKSFWRFRIQYTSVLEGRFVQLVLLPDGGLVTPKTRTCRSWWSVQ